MVRTGGAGRGWDRYGQVRYGSAVMARTGKAGLGTVRHGLLRQGGQDLVRLGGARLGPVRSVQARRSRSGVAGCGLFGSGGRGPAWRGPV